MAAIQRQSIILPRAAVAFIFFINGGVFANWLARIPEVQTKIGLSKGALGLALVGTSIGVIIGLLLAGGLIARFSSRHMTRIMGVFFSLSIIPIALAESFIGLAAALMLAGAVMSIMDVAMNTQAAEIERRANRPIMSSFHAAFSIGGFAGALMGSQFVAADVALLPHFALVGVIFAILNIVAAIPLVTIEGETEQGDSAVMQLPHRAVWALGAVAFASSVGEGSMGDWSALYLKEVVQTTESFAAYGFAAFSLLMTIGRLSGDTLAQRYNPAKLVRGGGVLAGFGVLLALIFPQPVPVLIGFAAVGAGLSIVIPLVFSAAGNISGLPSGAGIAGVATIGYAGFLAGPPIIGLLAEVTSYRVALLFVAILAFTLFFSGRTMTKKKHSG